MSRGQEPAVWLPTIRAGTGADVFTQRLCDALNASGVRAEIAWLPHRAEYLPWTVRVPRTPPWANIAHLNSWLPRRFWPKGLPTVVTVHHLVHDPAYRPFRSLAQAAYHRLLILPRELRAILGAGAITVVSGYVGRTVAEFSGRGDIAVIHNWIDGKAYVPGQMDCAQLTSPFRLFMAGSQTRRKGIDLLPALAESLGPGFTIRYAGGKKKLETPIPGVVELGRISEAELIREYQDCDAVLSLSRYEGFGYTALEGMACGKPFVGFATSGLLDVVNQGSGLLAPVNDVQALAGFCKELKANPAFASGMGASGRKRAGREFGMPQALDSYIRTYRNVAARYNTSEVG
jgi:glycosyltransferase involved in cell wall biosynthesis